MTSSKFILYTFLSFIAFEASHPRAGHAESVWRCDQSTCPDSLINDTEDIITRDWPTALTVFPPPILATCADITERCPHCIGGQIRTYPIQWSLELIGRLNTFLMGRNAANAGVSGTIKTVPYPIIPLAAARMRIIDESWNNTTLSYSFSPRSTQVPAVGGLTGVQDLGDIGFITQSGPFFTSPLHIEVDMSNFEWCTIGSETRSNGGKGGTQIFTVTLTSSATVTDRFAEGLRNQFRRAVRLASAGSTGVAVSEFSTWAHTPHVRVISGDFNGDSRSDIALVGGEGWPMVPVAFSNGDGSFSVTAMTVPDFPTWTSLPGVQVVAGDINGDGRTDLIAAGGPGWTTLPVALSNGDGTFTVLNKPNAHFPNWSTTMGAKLLAGDVNGDRRADLILTGGSGWSTIPVAFSQGDGTFTVTNEAVDQFPFWAQWSNVQATVANINNDGRADIVLAGGNWTTVPVAISLGNGRFSIFNRAEPSISAWSQGAGAKLLGGTANVSFSGILLTGGAGWSTLPVGISLGDGTFRVMNPSAPDFASWAQDPVAQAVSGDFNGDGLIDVALIGGTGWHTTPVAFSNTDVSFRVFNAPIQ